MVTIFRGIKTILIVSFLFLIGGTYLHAQQTPVSQNGKLQVLGIKKEMPVRVFLDTLIK